MLFDPFQQTTKENLECVTWKIGMHENCEDLLYAMHKAIMRHICTAQLQETTTSCLKQRKDCADMTMICLKRVSLPNFSSECVQAATLDAEDVALHVGATAVHEVQDDVPEARRRCLNKNMVKRVRT